MQLRFGTSIGVFVVLSLATAVALAASFSDTANSTYAGAIDYLRERGVIGGYADGTFRPGQTVNRAEFMKILVAGIGIDASGRGCFPDVTDEWFASFVCTAKEGGWVRGYSDGTFRPGNTVNMAEAIKMITLAWNYPLQSAASSSFSDVDVAAWYAPYVEAAVREGVLDAGATLGAGDDVTRGRLADLIARAMQLKGDDAVHPAAVTSSAGGFFRNPFRRGGGGGGDSRALGGSDASAAGDQHGAASSAPSLTAPSITFNAIGKNYGDSSFTLSPVSDSAGAFTFVSGNTGVATIVGSTVTIVAAGTSTITATQAAHGAFTSGVATATLTVSPIAPTLGGFGNISKYLGDLAFTLTAPTSNSAGTFTYVSNTPSVATVSGNTVTLVSNGTTTITATQAANGNYTSGTRTLTLTVFFGGCISAPCENGGTCTNEPGGAYSCSCEEGFSGVNCEMDGSNCAEDGPAACLNGGVCTPTAAHGECVCAACFMGSQCELYDALSCA